MLYKYIAADLIIDKLIDKIWGGKLKEKIRVIGGCST
jgi:hypothetical protein